MKTDGYRCGVRKFRGALRYTPPAHRGIVSACPFGAAVCTEWARRRAGLCLECWAGVLERANAVSEWLR